MRNTNAMNQYKKVGVQSSAANADPYTLTLMLFNGAVERLNTAKMHAQQNNVSLKCETIGKAIAIIDGLEHSLDMDKGGEIASNLASLYDYMKRQLLDVSVSDKPENIDEVISLLSEIRSGWAAIPEKERSPKRN